MANECEKYEDDLPSVDGISLFLSGSTLDSSTSMESLLQSYDNRSVVVYDCDDLSSVSSSDYSKFEEDSDIAASVCDKVCSDNNKGKKKSVQFSHVDVREYAICIGENSEQYPLQGPPVRLDWAYANKKTISLNEYERSCYKRELRRLDEIQRMSLLIRVGGYTELDFEKLELQKPVPGLATGSKKPGFLRRRHSFLVDI